MKKITSVFVLLLTATFLVANPLTAKLQQAHKNAAKEQVKQLFQEAYFAAEQSNDSVKKGKWKKVIKYATQSLEKYKFGRKLAQENDIKITTAVIYQGPDSEQLVYDPMAYMPDMEEQILFAKILKKDLSLKKAIDANMDRFAHTGGLFSSIVSGKKTDIRFYAISEAFRGWKHCQKEIASLGEKAKVTPADFCVTEKDLPQEE